MGANARQLISDAGVIKPRNRTIGSLRTQPIALPCGAQCLLTYAAQIIDVDHALAVDTMMDVRTAIRLVHTGTVIPPMGQYRWVEDFTDAIDFIKAEFARTGKPVRTTLDLETRGVDPYNPLGYIVSAQVTVKAGTADAVKFANRKACRRIGWGLRADFNFILTDPRVALYGANLKFDLNWIAKLWLITECTTFRMDTMLVGSLVDENRSNSLNVHAKIYTDLGGYDDGFNRMVDKSRMDLALAADPDRFLMYAGGDTDACYRVIEPLRQELLQEPRLARFYTTILHPAARAYEKVERVGWCVDREAYRELEADVRAFIAKKTEEVKSMVSPRLILRHTDKDGEINLTKPSFLHDVMFSPTGFNLRPKMKTAQTNKPSTAMKHLEMFSEHEEAGPFIKLLDEYGEATKTLNTYVTGFLEHLRSDGRFHPTHFLFAGDDHESAGGTNTGRISVKDPPGQTVPKHTKWAGKIRRCLVAPKGWLIGSNDYSQGELRIAACLAEEPTMLSAYRKGIDLHAMTGAKLAGYKNFEQFLELARTNPALFELVRQKAKAGNFGLLYGMSAEGFKDYAWYVYGVAMTLEEATVARDAFFSLYSRLGPWHEEQKAFARMHSKVYSPLGRVRHLPLIHSADRYMNSKAGRQAINSPVQGTLSDMALWATAIVDQRRLFPVMPVWGMVHDQLLFYFPENNFEYYARLSKEIMENLPFHEVGWHPQLTFKVDCQVGSNLAELKKLTLD
jgi:DNA polymerase I-like protein with 3'-5' exonuclease and polymerase domains